MAFRYRSENKFWTGLSLANSPQGWPCCPHLCSLVPPPPSPLTCPASPSADKIQVREKQEAWWITNIGWLRGRLVCVFNFLPHQVKTSLLGWYIFLKRDFFLDWVLRSNSDLCWRERDSPVYTCVQCLACCLLGGEWFLSTVSSLCTFYYKFNSVNVNMVKSRYKHTTYLDKKLRELHRVKEWCRLLKEFFFWLRHALPEGDMKAVVESYKLS